MRFKFRRLLTPVIVLLNLSLFYVVWKPSGPADYSFIIREFEQFEHDLEATISSIAVSHPSRKIFIISDDIIYPPISLKNCSSNCVLVNRAPAFHKDFASQYPLQAIDSEFIFLVPDSTELPEHGILEEMLEYLERRSIDFLALRYKSTEGSDCLHANVNIREWFLQLSYPKQKNVCNILHGKHLLLARKTALMKLSDPFMQPFPEALYVQMSALNFTIVMHPKHHVMDGKPLFTSQHNQWKKNQLDLKRRIEFFKTMGIKKVINEKGNTKWYGCRKDTPRCFGTVIEDMPSYLFAGKWTPPCCLDALRKTALHVFHELKNSGVRYWLEGGSLLGAFRSGDIIPWDYDVDIGIYLEDLHRNSWLRNAVERPTIDEKGYLWEKAVEGDFYRVQYSSVNHMHVDIFPFYSKNGTMTKNSWFKSHVQDKEFPETFLKPLASIPFLGEVVSAPNNIREFLAFKFGADAINKPAYPNPSKLAFPNT
ncbi:unnamed protein product [Bemisia tabaci]|uniref:Fukutin-related protein n=1 Tax=Bemisia tabaci TaxID=7038 RepID=A0A9P0AIH0_BEMTA|nr:unnamed protein product [Bemisia tabaci]